MTYTASTVSLIVVMAQAELLEGSWVKVLLQLGVAGLWLYWLTGHLKDQTARDDKRHSENIAVAKAHGKAMERLTLTCYDVLDELAENYPHAKQRVREVIRKDAHDAIAENEKQTP